MREISAVTLLIVSVMSLTALTACVSKRGGTKAEININTKNNYPDEVLRIATLNLAHGRKDSFSQFFLSRKTIQTNLDDIAQVLIQQQPHIVALQEADSTESFNHVKYLASQSHYPWLAQVTNVDVGFLSYGTALLSVLPLTESIKHTFAPSWPTLKKGFVLAELEWTSADNKTSRKIDIISVHLDFLRQSVRENQIKEMVDILSKRNNTTIIMGDFNSEWLSDESAIKKLSTMIRFKTYQPESSAFKTYKSKRLDWILITKDLVFTDYKVLPDTLSDHAMVIAEIRFNDELN